MRPARGSRLAVVVLIPLGVLCGAGAVSAGTNKATDREVIATITAPDTVEENTEVQVDVQGELIGGNDFWIFAYSVYEDTALIEADGFEWGYLFAKSYTFNKPVGEYTYTFSMGQRTFGHGWYDIPVALTVTVVPTGPELCDVGWNPPLTDTGRAGRVVPLKFTAYDCDTGELFRGEDVIVQVADALGNVIQDWTYTENPHTGIHIGDEQYHVNWDTDGDMTGPHVVTVLFSIGDVLTREITLVACRGASKPALGFSVENHPNPSTTIRYVLPEASEVRLVVYNLLGQQVRVLVGAGLAAGVHSVHWDGTDGRGRELTSGVYLYRLEAGPNVAVRKIVLVK